MLQYIFSWKSQSLCVQTYEAKKVRQSQASIPRSCHIFEAIQHLRRQLVVNLTFPTPYCSACTHSYLALCGTDQRHPGRRCNRSTGVVRVAVRVAVLTMISHSLKPLFLYIVCTCSILVHLTDTAGYSQESSEVPRENDQYSNLCPLRTRLRVGGCRRSMTSQ